MAPIDKADDFIVYPDAAFNGGPALERLREHFVTPVALFFVRNHGDVPQVDPATYCLRVDGLVSFPLTLSLQDLRSFFPWQTLNATLQCAGNRRKEMSQLRPVQAAVPWGAEAISTAEWGGVALRDVLAAAGVMPGARHMAFTGLDRVSEAGGDRFGGSIPAEKALSGEVLLALEMNGRPLPPTHGFPLRVVVPGYIGARSVKWLASVRVQAEPSDNYFMTRAYRLRDATGWAGAINGEAGFSLGELPVNAVICRPGPDARVAPGPVRVEGYAMAGGGRRIVWVEASADDGATWVPATLLGEPHRWAWRFWKAELYLAPGRHRLAVRAWDEAANTQPERVAVIWNCQGYMNNALHCVDVRVGGAA